MRIPLSKIMQELYYGNVTNRVRIYEARLVEWDIYSIDFFRA